MSFVRWLRNLVVRLTRRSSISMPLPELHLATDEDQWNRLVDRGWLERWHPGHGRREWLWARRVGDQIQVFPGSEDRPRTSDRAHYYINGNLIYRLFDHPDGPSSVPWFVVRRGRVYPAEGYPGGSTELSRYRIEQLAPRCRDVRIRPVGPQDWNRGETE